MTDSAYSSSSRADIELNDIAKAILELIETRPLRVHKLRGLNFREGAVSARTKC